MLAWLEDWPTLKARYSDEVFSYEVRGKEIQIPTKRTSLSNKRVSKVALPTLTGWSDLVKYAAQENLPGSFPYTAGTVSYTHLRAHET